VSRTKDAVYRESGEADYDEAGSPSEKDAQDQAERAPDTVVRPLKTHLPR
jgi:hypothetical protein